MNEKEAALTASAEIQQIPSIYHEFENVQPKQDELEWHPQHLHEVVAVAMVVKNWLRPRDRARERAKAEATAATVEVNTSLVFEPMAITVERIRVLRELGRTPSQSSIRLASGMRSGSKLSSASLNFAAAQMSAAASAGQTPRMENDKLEAMPQNQTADEAGPTGEEATMQPTVEQVQQAVQTEQTVAPVAVVKSNGNAMRGNNRPELTDTNTTEGQERALLGHEQRRSVAENLDNFVRQIGREISALPRLAVDPSGSGYACWTFVIYLVFLYNAIMCVLCVFDDTQSDQFFAFWMSMNSICDILNLADLFVNSRLSYMDDGMLIKDWRRLTKRYMRSLHFGLDLVALLPLDLLLILNRSISLSRFNRLTKCYRVWQFVQMTNVRTDYPNAFRILHIVVVCLVLFHWNAALYFKISLLYGIFSIDPSASYNTKSIGCTVHLIFEFF